MNLSWELLILDLASKFFAFFSNDNVDNFCIRLNFILSYFFLWMKNGELYLILSLVSLFAEWWSHSQCVHKVLFIRHFAYLFMYFSILLYCVRYRLVLWFLVLHFLYYYNIFWNGTSILWCNFCVFFFFIRIVVMMMIPFMRCLAKI